MDVPSDAQRQDEERTHPRDNESDAGCRKDHGDMDKLVRACDQKQGSTLAVFRYHEHPRFSGGLPDSPAQ